MYIAKNKYEVTLARGEVMFYSHGEFLNYLIANRHDGTFDVWWKVR